MVSNPAMRSSSARILLLLVIAAVAAAVPLRSQSPDDDAHRIRGTVRDERGRPMAGVWIFSALRKDFTSSCTSDGLSRFAKTDLDGHFVLDSVPNGENLVYFRAPSYTSVVGHEFGGGIAMPRREFAPQLYRYLPGIDDRPVRHYVNTMIDSTGRVELRNANEPGTHDEFKVHNGYVTTYAPGTARIDGAQEIRIPGVGISRADIVVRQAPVVSIRATTNEPWGRAFLLSGEQGCAAALEGDDGYFMFTDVPLGLYTLATNMVSPHGMPRSWFRVGQVSVTANARAWTLTRQPSTMPVTDFVLRQGPEGPVAVRRGGSVSGRAVDAANRPLAGVRLRLSSQDRRAVQMTVSTDERGRYAFRGVVSGIYHLDATSNAYGTVCYGQRNEHDRAVDVVVEGERTVQIEPIVFRNGAVSGVVLDESGRPVPYATLSAPDREWESADEDGRFRIDRVSSGTVTILTDFWRTSEEGEHRFYSFSRSVNVRPNMETRNVRFQPTASEGTAARPSLATTPAEQTPTASLTLRTDEPKANLRVDLVRLPDQLGDVLDHVVVDVGLPAHLTRVDVRPGRYVVEAMQGDRSIASASSNGIDLMDNFIDLRAGDDRTIWLATSSTHCCRMEGRVQDRKSFTNKATVVIFPTREEWRTARSRRIRVVRPRTDLRFVVDDLPPGSYHVVAIPMWTEEHPGAAFFERLTTRATTLTLSEGRGQQEALTLKVTPID